MQNFLILLIVALTSYMCRPVIDPDSISNPDNYEYVVEVAFNLDIPVDSVTQEQFNDRYIPEVYEIGRFTLERTNNGYRAITNCDTSAYYSSGRRAIEEIR